MIYRYSKNNKGKPVKIAVIYTKNEHNIKLEKIEQEALKAVFQLKDYGYQAYIVGGAVRDLLIGNIPKDFDIVTDATPNQIKKIFRNSRIIGKRFRLVHVFYGQKIYEVSTFRSIVDGSVGNTFGTMNEDVKRRDFTLNALYYDPEKQQIIDYVGAMKDIKRKFINPIIPFHRIFEEDPVRMLRAVKYSCSTGFKMSKTMEHKIKKAASLLSMVCPSRLTEEMLKIINSGHAFQIVSYAIKLDLYVYMQPLATGIMKENKKFQKSYLENLKKLDQEVAKNKDIKLGKKLVYLIQDYVNSLSDWKKEYNNNLNFNDLYKQTWKECRNFILPINPQRSELEFAITQALKINGINIPAKTKRRRYEIELEKPEKCCQ
ncbi:MAG: polynucleotide adenylyltransferase PcnB [Treponemataceae bacterium]